MFLGYHVGLGIRPGSAARDNSSLNYGGIFSSLVLAFLKVLLLEEFFRGTMR